MNTISKDNIKKLKQTNYLPIILGIILLLLDINIIILAAKEYALGILFGIFIIFNMSYFIFKTIQINKYIQLMEYLKDNGKLIKGLSFDKEDKKLFFNKILITRPVVDYNLNNNIIRLYGSMSVDLDNYNEIDLLIDENNPTNYILGFNLDKNDILK